MGKDEWMQVSEPVNVSHPCDADGKLVKRWAGQTTVYVGELYEKNTSTGQVTKYYTLGQRRVAVRIGGTPYWLLVDHLGSSMVLVDGSGNKWKEQWYYPFGEKRYPATGDITIDRRFTGQRRDGTIELYDYKARYYDPLLGRFVQPDTVVPEPGNPQALNRYAYALNNPLRYTDPSGHAVGIRYQQWEIALPSWARSGIMHRALSVGCFFLSCHVDAERGVLKGPTVEEFVNNSIQPMPMSVAGGVAGNIADDVADDIVRGAVKKAKQLVLPGFEDLVSKTEADEALSGQIHHLLTNKHSKWMARFEQIIQKYGLDLDEAWNKVKVPQRGRHPEKYHE